MIKEIDLKGCPFCGGKAVIHNRDVEPQGDTWYGSKMAIFVGCQICGCVMFDEYFHEGFADEAAAAKTWNSRAHISGVTEK